VGQVTDPLDVFINWAVGAIDSRNPKPDPKHLAEENR